MASAMIAQSSISSPVFAPSMTHHPSLFCKTARTMMTPLPSPPSSPHPFRFHRQPTTDHTADRGMSLLRKKRPASLALPTSSFEYACSDVAPSIRVLEEQVVEADGEGYGVYSKKGKKRGPSEDRYSAVNYGDVRNKKQALFGVFDGHGGSKAAEFAAKSLDKNIMRHVLRNGDSNVEKAVREGYLETDSAFMGEEDACGGACCVTALIHEGNLVVSNVGDCRAVMSRSGVAEALTSDHKPSDENERSRMQHLVSIYIVMLLHCTNLNIYSSEW